MDNICVFCGSNSGRNETFDQEAKSLGRLMVKNKKTLIYGGGNVGLMGAIADTVIEAGGKVIGVIPEFLMQKEVGHLGLSELIVVSSMHERKNKMAELSDAFIAMPGGLGTLEELAEILTWVQIGLIRKPVAVLNVSGYYDFLFSQMDHMVKNGFLQSPSRQLLLNISSSDEIINALESHNLGGYSMWDGLDRT